MSKKPATIFSWGYYGWGSATKQLVKAVDAVETARGFKPPIFVDIRLKRQGRAVGFKGNAFEKLLGPTRHRWMNSLGNLRIASHTGPSIQIADPSAAEDLLNLALEAAEDRRRLLFFCGCDWPKGCHRSKVASLVQTVSRKQGESVQVVEWPGGEPEKLEMDLSKSMFDALAECKQLFIPLGKRPDLSRFAGLPTGTVIEGRFDHDMVRVISGPAVFRREQWHLPCFWFCGDMGVAWAKKKAAALRRSWGIDARK